MPSTVVFHTSQANGVLTDFFVLGGLTVAVALQLDGCVDVNRSGVHMLNIIYQ